jgi:hypothetical protein
VIRDEYVREVGYRLSDLPWSTRRDLLRELRGHLDELPPETDLLAQLGPPEKYAADLRSAAGLERRRGPIAFLRARRPHNLIVAVVTLAVIGLAIGTVVWIRSYQPLAAGNVWALPFHTRGAPGIEGQAAVVREGRPFQFGITVVNNRRFAVRVLGVPYEEPLPWTARLMMSPTERYGLGPPQPDRPFHPFDLKPGDWVFLSFKGVYACHSGWAVGAAETFYDFPVRYRFLWRTSTTEIPLPEPLAFSFPKGCPTP